MISSIVAAVLTAVLSVPAGAGPVTGPAAAPGPRGGTGAMVRAIAAGNYGPTASTVLSPANLPEALSVGDVDDSGAIDGSSSRGPSACGQATAPRLVAPGVGVHTTDLYGGYLDATGTSMAAPHAAGVLALLLSAHPGLSADRQQAALEATGFDLGGAGPDNTYGYGRVDALAAYQRLGATPDYTVAVSPSQAGTVPGGGVSYTVTVSPLNGFSGDVALSLGAMSAAQAAWTFSPAVIPGGTGTATLGVDTAATITPGTYPLTITAAGGGLTRTAPATLVVTGSPDFTVTVSPASRTVAAGAGTGYTVSVGGTNGFTGTVGLSLSGLPATVGAAAFAPTQVAAAFAPTQVAAGGSAQLSITTLAGAAPGTYALTVTGTSGSTSHAVTVTLQVNPPPDFTLTAALGRERVPAADRLLHGVGGGVRVGSRARSPCRCPGFRPGRRPPSPPTRSLPRGPPPCA